jgi:hypothetical protein
MVNFERGGLARIRAFRVGPTMWFPGGLKVSRRFRTGVDADSGNASRWSLWRGENMLRCRWDCRQAEK